MTCRLLQNIKHSCEYNPGGITNIYLLDIRDFQNYRFAEDKPFTECFVERIVTNEPFREIAAVSESNFVESFENGVYKQDLSTFVQTLEAEKLSNLLIARNGKHLVAFRTSQGLMYCFGSDGGALLSFTQITGQQGEVSGYQIVIGKQSQYPLFQLDASRFNSVPVLGTENRRVVATEDGTKAILTE